MDVNKLEIAVNNIEQDIFDSTDGVEYFNISLLTNGFSRQVSFCGIVLWNDDEGDCLYLNEVDNSGLFSSIQEDIEVHLRRRLNEELSKLKTIIV